MEYEIEVYLDNGVVYKYPVTSHEKVREHISAIVKSGYRHNDGKTLVHYPPHRIDKVKCDAWIPTKYQDTVTGT